MGRVWLLFMLIFKGLLVPGIRKTQSGDLQVYREMAVTNGSKMECAIRMLEYVEGDICQKLPLCDEFFYEIGKIRDILSGTFQNRTKMTYLAPSLR